MRITAAILEGLREKDEAVLRVDGKVAEVEAAGGKITTGAFFKEQGLTSKKGIGMLEAAADRALGKVKGVAARAAAKAATAEAKSATAAAAANEEEELLMRAKPGTPRASFRARMMPRIRLIVVRAFVEPPPHSLFLVPSFPPFLLPLADGRSPSSQSGSQVRGSPRPGRTSSRCSARSRR